MRGTHDPRQFDSYVMTIKECATYLRVHPSSVYRMLKGNGPNGNPKLPSFKVGSDWRFLKASLDQWMLDCQVVAAKTGRDKDDRRVRLVAAK